MDRKNWKHNNLIVAISGPSGVGKGTIVKWLLNATQLNLKLNVSATTRKRREKEVDGREYFFITEDQFSQKVKNDEFIEWIEYGGAHYGTLTKTIDDLINSYTNVLLEIDYRGVVKLKKIFGSKNIFSIFVLPPSFEVLKKRLINRSSENMVSINQRTIIAHDEINHTKIYDLCVTNDNLERCCSEIFEVLKGKIR